ncbi:MAG: hypothetical protein KBT20_11675 [Bacteroidales bacterium]|nr:hypothetical protein [Candidatus Liminaster caballi]
MNQPLQQVIFWNFLGKQLKIWRNYHIVDAYACKLLKLWLGYEFTDLMDLDGIIRVNNFNDIKARLSFSAWSKALDVIRMSQSFYIIGDEKGRVTGICSPLWHKYEEIDGVLLSGSIKDNDEQCSAHCSADNLNKIFLNKKTTVSTSGEVTAALCMEEVTDRETRRRQMMERRQKVHEYFEWMLRQTDIEHTSLVDDMRRRVRFQYGRDGKVIEEKTLSEFDTEMAMTLLFDVVLVNEFARNDQFFKPNFIAHPDNRRYWLKNYMPKCFWRNASDARRLLAKRKKELTAKAMADAQDRERQNRPISEFEWMGPDGVRYYEHPTDHNMRVIPADAEPRPDETKIYNKLRKIWL